MRYIAALIVVVTLLTGSTAFAQTSVLNVAKYVELRERLRSDFLLMGTEAGMSLPAQERLPGDYIRWADGTIDLGWYLGVLGSELNMRMSGQFQGVDGALSSIDTADELALALLALQRLDEQGDAAFPECGGTPALNGFFIRDDVPAGFHANFAGMTRTRSDFIDTPATLKEMSQDQVYHVLMGLAVVHALVPSDVTARGISLSENASEQAERIIRKMADDRWLIQNPACDRQVARGHSATAYSPGTAAAGGWFTNGAYTPETSAVAQGVWDLAKDAESAFYMNVDNLHMAMSLSAIGQGWGEADTLSVLMELATPHGWYLYPLLNQALHDNPNWCDHRDFAIDEAKSMLNELPVGEFPRNPRPDVAVHGFTTWNRFIRGSDSHYVGPAGNDGREQHGLDYMLLHNLAAIAAPELWSEATAECVRPATGADMGSTDTPDGGPVAMDDVGGSSLDVGSSGPDGDMINPIARGGDPADGCCGVTPAATPTPWLLLFGFAVARVRSRRAR